MRLIECWLRYLADKELVWGLRLSCISTAIRIRRARFVVASHTQDSEIGVATSNRNSVVLEWGVVGSGQLSLLLEQGPSAALGCCAAAIHHLVKQVEARSLRSFGLNEEARQFGADGTLTEFGGCGTD